MFEETTTVEKIGLGAVILGLFGGFLVACTKIVHFIAGFAEEHQRLMKHLEEVEEGHMITRFVKLEQTMETAAQERQDMLVELRAIRTELQRLYLYLIRRADGEEATPER